MRWTKSDLKKLQARGVKVEGMQDELPRPKRTGASPSPTSTPTSPTTRITELLRLVPGIPDFGREVRFYPGRNWAFDIAFHDQKVAVEYEGNTWVKGASRHTTGAGYRNDVDKYNAAAIEGWCVVRLTADMLRDETYLDLILKALEASGWKSTDNGPKTDDRHEGPKGFKTFEELWAEQNP